MEEWYRSRRKTKFILLFHFFVLGTEFSIILPTLVSYLDELRTQNTPFFFGLIYAAYFCSGMIFSMTLGRLADLTLAFRNIIICINIINIAGNALYTIGGSPFVLLAGRFLCGAGDALIAISYGEFGRCYDSSELQTQAGHLMIGYCVGMCIGPGFNMIPKNIALVIGSLRIRYTNAPGLLLFFLCLLLLLSSCIGISNLSLNKKKLLEEGLELMEKPEENMEHFPSTNAEAKMLPQEAELRDGRSGEKESKTTSPWWQVLRELLSRQDIRVLLYGQMTWAYSTVSGDVMLPLTAINILHFSPQALALCYLVAGFWMSLILVFGSRMLSVVGPVQVAIAAFIGFATAFASLSLTYVSADKDTRWLSLLAFFIYLLTFNIGWCCNSIALKSVLSYRVQQRNQSFSQGFFSSIEYLTSIMAGLTSGLVFDTLLIYCTWTVIFNIAAVILFSFYYEDLRHPIENVDLGKIHP